MGLVIASDTRPNQSIRPSITPLIEFKFRSTHDLIIRCMNRASQCLMQLQLRLIQQLTEKPLHISTTQQAIERP